MLINTDQLKKIIDVCHIHLKRLNVAHQNIQSLFPITETVYQSLSGEKIAFLDQYIFRFAKLQDTIGDKLFKQILIISDEQVENLSFRDILNKIEKFGIINDRNEWIQMREIRNDVSHEYPVISDEAIVALNNIYQLKVRLEMVFESCLQYLNLSIGFNEF